jgi:hypothetical protein
MASEQKIRAMLDMLTSAPAFKLETIDDIAAPEESNKLISIADSPNIVAMGISEKTSGGETSGKLALTFYVEEKLPAGNLAPGQMIPGLLKGLGGGEPIPTDVVALGKIRPEVNALNTPIRPGNSVGHVDILAGTLGAILTDGKDFYLLSNAHVLARSGLASKGDPIIYPAKLDGGKYPGDVIARLHEFIPFILGPDYTNRVDCAVAKILPQKLPEVIARFEEEGFPTGMSKPKRGMKVIKVGRTTGRTEGEIRDVDIRVPVPYGAGIGEVRFMNQVLCTRFTDSGDSGSLVIDKETGKAVGLHFCGADRGSIFNPLHFVLDSLKLKLFTNKIKTPGAKKSGKTRQPAISSNKRMSVSEETARMARDMHFEHLQKLGAHTLAVDTIKGKNKNSYGIIAFVEDNNIKLPNSVEVSKGNFTAKVPVVVEHSVKFKPE